jgi:hypothetical protein
MAELERALVTLDSTWIVVLQFCYISVILLRY